MAQWGRIGVQIHEAAAVLFEKSKKTLVGDGSYLGFVTTVLKQVPSAKQPAEPYESFGYLIYGQTASEVWRRASDLMPGDVIVLQEARFKGHKGLHSYNITVGVGEPLVGVVGDYEVKKAKVKVFQANQHVGQQSVELASYRLDDLKSGTVKVCTYFLTPHIQLRLCLTHIAGVPCAGICLITHLPGSFFILTSINLSQSSTLSIGMFPRIIESLYNLPRVDSE
ncbi:hypothetical protein CERSUDRAFT_46345 [Gelatoporia subvermispora B]|uniref:BBC1/AIM3 cysteine proteinase-fold domain-containing protein n=1 Tax=Ceriporiopsis subvermispora (strain B) TaxID=914234 RepID=M2QT22_CERS8|nr:hypothetical protein CERSUDRAFT_46345 [Gelatoporia subvermispora B]